MTKSSTRQTISICRTIALLTVVVLTIHTAIAQKARLVVPSGHTNPVISLALNSDETLLASSEGLPAIKIWSAMNGTELYSLVGHTEAVNEVAFQPGGQLLASASNDKSVIVWDMRKAAKRMVLAGHTDAVTSIRFFKDGTRIVSGSYDGTIRTWSMADASQQKQIAAGGPVHCLAINSGENLVACGTRAGDIIIFDDSGQKTATLHIGAVVNDMVFSPDDKNLLAADNSGKIHVFSVSPAQLVKTIPSFSYRAGKIIFLGANQVLAVGRDAKRNVVSVNTETGEEVKSDLTLDDANALNFEVGINTALASKDGNTIYLPNYTSGIRSFDIKQNKVVTQFDGKAKPINGLSLDPSGRYLAIASNRDEVFVLDLTGASDAKLLAGHKGWVRSIAFHPVEKRLITSADDKTIKVWDTDDWYQKSSFPAEGPFAGTPIAPDTAQHGFYKKAGMSGVDFFDLRGKNRTTLDLKEVFDFHVTPNGQLLIAKSPGTLTFYPGPKFKKGAKLSIPNVMSFQVYPDGTKFITIDGQSIKIFDLASRKELKTISMGSSAGGGHIKLIAEKNLALTWNTSVTKFGTSADNTIKVWNLETGDLVSTWEGHASAITAVEVLNHQFVFTSSTDGTVRVWSLEETESQKANKASIIPLDDKNWVVTTGVGLFDATGPAMLGLHYVQQTEIIDINQLKDTYYEPSLLPKILGFNKEPIRTAAQLSELSLYPEINLLHPSLNNGTLGIELREQGGGYGRVVILINDKEIAQNVRDVKPIDKAQPEVTLSYNIAGHPFLKEGEMNKISVKAYNEKGDLVSTTKSVILLPDAAAKRPKPKLYALLSGVSDYVGDEIDLKFAAKDASDMADALRLSADKYLGQQNATIELLTTDNKDAARRPTKANIRRIMDEFSRKANASDILFIYLSGHGISYGGPDGDFYYLTADARNAKLDDSNVRSAVALSSQEITNLISSVPAIKQLMIIDACHAAQLASDLLKNQTTMSSSDVRALESMKDKTGLYVLAGSAADAVSYEASAYGQGLLTYSILFGIKGPALRDDEYVDVMRLFQFATEKVPQLVAGIGGVQKPEMRVPNAASSFDIGVITEAERAKIHLNNPKPVFIQSQINDEAQDFDALDVSAEIDSQLRAVSAGGTGKIDFIDQRKFTGAYAIRGKYAQKDGQINAHLKMFKDSQLTKEFDASGANATELARAIIDLALKTVTQ